jgi:hypothetical protein
VRSALCFTSGSSQGICAVFKLGRCTVSGYPVLSSQTTDGQDCHAYPQGAVCTKNRTLQAAAG